MLTCNKNKFKPLLGNNSFKHKNKQYACWVGRASFLSAKHNYFNVDRTYSFVVLNFNLIRIECWDVGQWQRVNLQIPFYLGYMHQILNLCYTATLWDAPRSRYYRYRYTASLNTKKCLRQVVFSTKQNIYSELVGLHISNTLGRQYVITYFFK